MVDVTVRGAGIFGLSIARICARRGAKVQVVDPSGPGAGSSGGLVGALAPHVPENWNAKKAFQFDSLIMAEPFWRQIEDTGGVSPAMASWAACSRSRTRVVWNWPASAKAPQMSFGKAGRNGVSSPRPKRVLGAHPAPQALSFAIR